MEILAMAVLALSSIPLMLLIRGLDSSVTFIKGYIVATIINIILYVVGVKCVHDFEDYSKYFIIIAGATGAVSFIFYVFVRRRELMVLAKTANLHTKTLCLLLFAVAVLGVILIYNVLLQQIDNSVYISTQIRMLENNSGMHENVVAGLGYDMVRVFGISPQNVICCVIPGYYYWVAVAGMWDVGGMLYHKEYKKKIIFFICTALFMGLGDALYFLPHLIIHGLADVKNILLILCLILLFSVGIESVQLHQDYVMKSKLMRLFIIVLCVLGSAILDKQISLICSICAISFAVIILERRWKHG